MLTQIQVFTYLALLTLSLLIGLRKYKILDTPSRIIVILLLVTLISESLSYVLAVKYSNNMPLYHFFNPIELSIIAIYYNYSIKTFRKRNIGYIIAIIGTTGSILNSIFLQPIDTLNSYFLLFEGLLIIFMSLYSYIEIFRDIDLYAITNPHFWFSSIFIFISGITYANWALYSFIAAEMVEVMPHINAIILLVSTIAYAGFGVVFIFIHKMYRSEQ